MQLVALGLTSFGDAFQMVKIVIRQGHKSFPSGHTSWAFAGLGFLSLYLAGKIKAFDGKGHVAKLCVVLLL
ncbi:UNVERIFIED_CONTAM: putative lipid phosphate phosphatase 3, chloroplastic [Sesamum radiatum]|uniref:Lipid phosphate phosphatase 3, chloroplastic n=1 Tax=Sesamum radiatum TaxID=300843 RepID=A0AAW2V3V9_SESRA